jgi:hypothetical protein
LVVERRQEHWQREREDGFTVVYALNRRGRKIDKTAERYRETKSLKASSVSYLSSTRRTPWLDNVGLFSADTLEERGLANLGDPSFWGMS